jgi:3-hydroxyacyl-[acyl-carrier-protein] dehydratase
MVIGLKFCGGCNPVIDRGALVKSIETLLPNGWRLETEPRKEHWDRALLVCGCPTACADKPEIKILARQWILISGPMIDHITVQEKDLVEEVVKNLKKEMRLS